MPRTNLTPRVSKVTVRKADGTVEVVRKDHFRPKRRTAHWHNLRLQALDRDGERCVDCGGNETLEVHHLTYVRRGKERLEDVVTLCQRCHATRHQWMKR